MENEDREGKMVDKKKDDENERIDGKQKLTRHVDVSVGESGRCVVIST
jgi:hypothetical protein